MYEITALGELLIDFTPCGQSDAGMRLFEQNPGGAVANVLAAAAKLGRKTAFIGKVGDDLHGRFLKKTLDDANIDTRALIMSDEAPTTLAFVELDENGERQFCFIRKPGADTLLRTDELDDELLSDTRILHIGSLSLTDEPSRSATLEAVKRARASGAIITYDPNNRARLWQSEEQAIGQMRSVLPYANLVKMSASETALLTGERDPATAINKLLGMGVDCAVVTGGGEGAFVGMDGAAFRVDSFRRNAVDTTGAGDAFWGGFLTAILMSGKQYRELRLEDMLSFARFGNAVAACSVMHRGAIPAMPTLEQVRQILG